MSLDPLRPTATNPLNPLSNVLLEPPTPVVTNPPNETIVSIPFSASSTRGNNPLSAINSSSSKEPEFTIAEIAHLHTACLARLRRKEKERTYLEEIFPKNISYENLNGQNILKGSLSSDYPLKIKIIANSSDDWINYTPAILIYLQNRGISHRAISSLEALDKPPDYNESEEQKVTITIEPNSDIQLKQIIEDLTALMKEINPPLPQNTSGRIPGAYMIMPFIGVQDEEFANPFSTFDAAELLARIESILIEAETNVLEPSSISTQNSVVQPLAADDNLFASEKRRFSSKVSLIEKNNSGLPEQTVEATIFQEGDYYYIFVGEEPIGSISLLETSDGLQIEYLRNYCKDEQSSAELSGVKQYKGIGTALMRIAIDESIRRGLAGRIVLKARPSSVPFYQALGFEKVEGTSDHMFLSERKGMSLAKSRKLTVAKLDTPEKHLPDHVQRFHDFNKTAILKNRQQDVYFSVLAGRNIRTSIAGNPINPMPRILGYLNDNSMEGEKAYQLLISDLQAIYDHLDKKIVIPNHEELLFLYTEKMWLRPRANWYSDSDDIPLPEIYALRDFFHKKEFTDADLKLLDYISRPDYRIRMNSLRNAIYSLHEVLSDKSDSCLRQLIDQINLWDPLHSLPVNGSNQEQRLYGVGGDKLEPNFQPKINNRPVRLDDKQIPRNPNTDDLIGIEATIQACVKRRGREIIDLILRQSRMCVRIERSSVLV